MRHKVVMLRLSLLTLLLWSDAGWGHDQKPEPVGYASSKPPTQELPRPLTLPTELTFQQSQRNTRSRRPTLMDVALQQSVQQGLNAMAELYGRIQPQMLLNGVRLVFYC